MNGLYVLKPWFVRRLKRAEDFLVDRNVRADSVTASAVFVSVVTGSLIAFGATREEPTLWLLVPFLGIGRLALNALDGSLARRTGTGRPFGEVLNEVGDRLSDAALLVPLAFVAPIALVLAALVATQLASTAGALGHVVGSSRLSTGPMGKADRVAVISSAAFISGLTGSVVPFTLATAVIALGSAATAIARLFVLHKLSRATV